MFGRYLDRVRPGLRLAARWAVYGLLVHVALVGVFLMKYDGNPQWFVHFGKEGSVLPVARQVFGNDLLIPHIDGHDGQAYWLIARDPLLLDGKTVVGPHLDRPGYRAQRILYPALAAPWRLAGEDALVWGLLVTNLAAVFAGGIAAGLLALDLRAPPRASLAFALSPGVFVATIMDGSDAIALAAFLAVVLGVVRRRPGWALVGAVAAVLAKEPMLAGIAGIAFVCRTIPVRWRVALVAVPTGAAVAWGLYARWRLGWPPSGVQEFAFPFYGYVDAYRRGWRPVGNWADAVIAVALIPLALIVVRRWVQRGGILLSAAVPFVAMIPLFSGQVLDLAVNTMRAAGPPITLLWLDAYVPVRSAIASIDRPPLGDLRAIRRWGSRSRPSPAARRG
jgi:hypothetical protein